MTYFWYLSLQVNSLNFETSASLTVASDLRGYQRKYAMPRVSKWAKSAELAVLLLDGSSAQNMSTFERALAEFLTFQNIC